jgi:tRNA A-37 threonylcarbamoyl transferase component Bud32
MTRQAGAGRTPTGVLPQPGDVIAGKYAVVRRIGEGGMAVVYEATHLRLHQPLAIKVLRPDVADSQTVLARFEREARATAQLRSVHAARVIDVDMLPSGLPYMVMEYLEGHDLDVEIANTGAMPVARAVDIVLQTAGAMQEAHALGIVHRDLKPANLFLCPVADRNVVKVLDFGISKIEGDGDARLTVSNAYFGTPAYCAPEQLRDAGAADARSDVWALGVILFELLTGRTPFEGGPTAVIAKVMTDPIPWPTELRPDLPRDLARVVMRALQREPKERFQTMHAMAEALAPFGPSRTAAAVLADAQRGRGKLGEILVADGLLTAADLEKALAEQRRSGNLLGRLLIEMELVSHADLLAALAKQQGITSIGPPSKIDVERRSREAPTFLASPAEPVASRGPAAAKAGPGRLWLWVAVGVGLPVGILFGLWAGGVIGHPAHAEPAHSVGGPR